MEEIEPSCLAATLVTWAWFAMLFSPPTMFPIKLPKPAPFYRKVIIWFRHRSKRLGPRLQNVLREIPHYFNKLIYKMGGFLSHQIHAHNCGLKKPWSIFLRRYRNTSVFWHRILWPSYAKPSSPRLRRLSRASITSCAVLPRNPEPKININCHKTSFSMNMDGKLARGAASK